MNVFKFVIRLVLPLLLITVLVAAALGGINALTGDRIAQTQAEKLQNAIQTVLPGGADAVQIDFSAEAHPLVKSVYACEAGYAIEVHPAGFGGTISMMVGVSKDGRVLGVSIIRHTETAGLGAVAGANTTAGQNFRDSFTGLSYPVYVSKDGGEADSITGATITSRAISEGVNAALVCAENLNMEDDS